MKMYIRKCTMVVFIAISVIKTAQGIEKVELLNNFRAIMKGATTIVNYIPKVSSVTIPLLGDPNANPPIEGAIDKEQKALDASFKPIKDKLFVLEQIESQQPWLLEMACLGGGKNIVDDVKNIQSILNGTLNTLKSGLTDIHKLATSPELENLRNSIEKSEAIKQVMVQIAELHPEVQKAAEQAGVISPSAVGAASQSPLAPAQPTHITYQRLLTVRNIGKTPVTIKQINISENSKDMFGNDIKMVAGKRELTVDKQIAPEETASLGKVTNGTIDLAFTYDNKVVTAQIPAGEEKTMCIDVNEEAAKTVSCELQSLTYTRTLKINNTGKTAAAGMQINIRGNDLFNQNQSNRHNATTQELGVLMPNTPITLGATISTGALDLEFQFLGADKKPTGPKVSGSIPAVAKDAQSCIEFNEAGVKIVQGGWCGQTTSAQSRNLLIKNEGTSKLTLLQINIPQGASDMFNRPLAAGITTVDFGSIAASRSFPWDNVSREKISVQFTYPPASPLPPFEIPAGADPVCIVVNNNGAQKVDCPK